MTTVDCRNREALDADILERFRQAVDDDDFNFPAGLAVLFELAKEISRAQSPSSYRKMDTPRQCWSGNGIRLSALRRS